MLACDPALQRQPLVGRFRLSPVEHPWYSSPTWLNAAEVVHESRRYRSPSVTLPRLLSAHDILVTGAHTLLVQRLAQLFRPRDRCFGSRDLVPLITEAVHGHSQELRLAKILGSFT